MSRYSRQILVVVSLIATLAMNAVANLLPLNGRTTGEISNQFEVFITPAGYVFSIWSLIYLGLAAYAIHQFGTAARRSPRIVGIARPFVASCIANIVWLELWHYGFYTATLAAMLALLASLVVIYLRLVRTSPASPAEKWCVDVPFSLYTGWVTVATLVNLSVVLEVQAARPFGWSAPAWAIAMVAVAGVIGLFVGHRRNDWVYQAVEVWAAVGIAVRPGQSPGVATAATACAIILTLHILARRILQRRAAA